MAEPAIVLLYAAVAFCAIAVCSVMASIPNVAQHFRLNQTDLIVPVVQPVR
ncbi:MAG: hypothetical protein WA901_14190 [Phormidesmis sp.]